MPGLKVQNITHHICKNTKQGFTLIESLMVIAIIGILVLIAIPRFNSAGIRVRTVSRQIMDDMRYARSIAVTENRIVTVDFSSDTQYVIDGVTKLLPDGFTCTATPTSFTFQKLGSASNNVILIVAKSSYSITLNITASTGMVYKNGS